MQFIGSDLRNRLTYGIYAVALVCSLVIYKSAVDPKPLTVVPQHSRAIAPEDSNSTTALPTQQAVLQWSEGVWNKVYQGKPIYPFWQKFFSQY